MTDIRQWLDSLDLGEYAAAFEEHAIGWELLNELDHDVLKDIGVGAAGHRLQILKAARALADERTAVASSAANDHPSAASPVATAEAERRQLTVMFCDLVGSTELSQRLDPEDLREINRAYQDAVKAAIEKYGGYVARYMGDGVLAYFGYPRAQENDTERAVRSGLDVVADLRALDQTLGAEHGVPLACRVGIATGEVVVGDLIGEGASQESAVIGDTPNLAARLQAIAEPSQVLISSDTHALTRGLFQYEHLGHHELRGFGDPVQVWRAISPSAVESRFEALHPVRVTPLVGREHEVGLLLDRWEQSMGGDGQVVFLSGEAGIGKSRIIETVRERTAVETPIRLRYQCSPHHIDSALHPFIEQLSRAARFERRDPDSTRLEKLEALLGIAAAESDRVVPLLASLLSISTEGRTPALDMAPEQKKDATLEALVSQFEGLVRSSPVQLVFEDAHWADATSLELLGLLVERTRDAPALLLITFRTEFVPPWATHSYVTHLTLNRLSRGLVLEMINGVTSGKTLPDEIVDRIIERTDGIPLFVEELTKTIVESDLLQDRGDHFALAGPLPSLAIPRTLRDSLMARLDRLASVREVAQTAAAIGREFSPALLARVHPPIADDLDDALAQLVDAGLLFRRGAPPRLNYAFKHALVQDAAYESMLKSTRRNLHGRIAEVLTNEADATAATEPEVIAHHYTEAGLAPIALDYWLEAGRRATERAAYLEAVAHLGRGLTLIEDLPTDSDRARREIELRVALGVPLTNKMDAGAPNVGENYRRARALCEAHDVRDAVFPILWGLWYYHMLAFEVRQACEVADELVAVGQGLNDESLELEAHHCQWASRFLAGDLEATLVHADQGLRLYRSEDHHRLSFVYGGHDPGVCAQDVGALTLWLSGYPDRAVDRMETALRHADELGQSSTLANATGKALTLAGLRRDERTVERLARELLEFAGVERAEQFRAHADAALGWVRFMRGARDEGITLMRTAIRGGLAQDPWNAYLFSMIAAALGDHGEVEEALALVDEALERCDRNDVHWWTPELFRVKGELLRHIANPTEGNGRCWFERAMVTARSRNAKALELRAAMSLARLSRGTDEYGSARDRLRSVYECFTEGFDSPDLVEARAEFDSIT